MRAWLPSTSQAPGGPAASSRLRSLCAPLAAVLLAACGAQAAVEEESEDVAGAQELAPNARVWRTRVALESCGRASLVEDFSTGRYNVHRYAFVLEPGGELVVELSRLAGPWQPALLLTTEAGELVHDGSAQVGGELLRVQGLEDGRTTDRARLSVSTERAASLRLYVSAWATVDNAYTLGLPNTAEYELRLGQECRPAMGTGDWREVYAGLEQEGSLIPRAGLANATLRAALGVRVEPVGTVEDFQGFDLVRGTISEFGGPNDSGVGPSETGAISGERLRALNDPLRPSAATLASRPERYYYGAMRFDYNPNGTSWWRGARLLVMNPGTGQAVVVRPVDWGPNTRTRRLIDLSPQTLVDLGLPTDSEVLVSFAGAGAALGPVR